MLRPGDVANAAPREDAGTGACAVVLNNHSVSGRLDVYRCARIKTGL